MSPLWIPSRQAAADVVHLGVSQGDRAWSVSAQRSGFFFLVLSFRPPYCALVLLSIQPLAEGSGATCLWFSIVRPIISLLQV